MAALVLLHQAGLAVEPRYLELARTALEPMQPIMKRQPLGFGQWLIALHYALSHPHEIAIIGNPDANDTRALLAVCATGYCPHQIIALGNPSVEPFPIPLLQNREQVDGQTTAYVCSDFTCYPPVTDPAALQKLLERH